MTDTHPTHQGLDPDTLASLEKLRDEADSVAGSREEVLANLGKVQAALDELEHQRTLMIAAREGVVVAGRRMGLTVSEMARAAGKSRQSIDVIVGRAVRDKKV